METKSPQLVYGLAASRVPGIGFVTFKKGLEESGNDPQVLFDYLRANHKIPSAQALLDQATADLEVVRKNGVSATGLWQKAYPQMLQQIADPPPILYSIGNLANLNTQKQVAVVGTRKMSERGKRWTQKFVQALVANGLGIVSGMAFGIDSTAHWQALASEGFTAAVLATSPEQPTPPKNSSLYQKILDDGGVVLSEALSEDSIEAWMFARRNRIIAGLSVATLIVEADIKSGALITAELAFDYARDVFAVPGDIDNALSRGTNKIILENKAKLVQSPQQLLQELGLTSQKPSATKELPMLSAPEQELVQLLNLQPKTADELTQKFDSNIGLVLSLLSGLELKGVVISDSQGYFRLQI